MSENKNRLFMHGEFRDEDKTAVRLIFYIRRGHILIRLNCYWDGALVFEEIAVAWQKTRGYQHDNSNIDQQAISLFALAGALIYCCSSATFCGGDTSRDQITRVLCRTNNPHIANNIFMGGNIVMHTDIGIKIYNSLREVSTSLEFVGKYVCCQKDFSNLLNKFSITFCGNVKRWILAVYYVHVIWNSLVRLANVPYFAVWREWRCVNSDA